MFWNWKSDTQCENNDEKQLKTKFVDKCTTIVWVNRIHHNGINANGNVLYYHQQYSGAKTSSVYNRFANAIFPVCSLFLTTSSLPAHHHLQHLSHVSFWCYFFSFFTLFSLPWLPLSLKNVEMRNKKKKNWPEEGDEEIVF